MGGPVSEEKPGLTGVQLQGPLWVKNQRAIQLCTAEIEQVLARHGCALMPVVQIRGQQIVSYVEIVRNS